MDANLADDPIMRDGGRAVPRPPRDFSAQIAAMNLLPTDDAKDAFESALFETLTPAQESEYIEQRDGVPLPPRAPSVPLPPLLGPDGKPVPAPYAPESISADVAAKPAYQITPRSLTTDLANAQRIQRHFGKQVLFAGGQWYGWTGKQWKPSTEAIWQCASQLSTLIHNEAISWRARAEAARAANHPENGMREDKNADQLEKYIPQAESHEKMNLAMSVLAKTSPAKMEMFDQDPWALNVNNGIVDLRTGILRPHDPDAFITKLIPIDYDPNANPTRFIQFVHEIMNESQLYPQEAEMTRFLQRWVGYGATGSTREQKFAVHHGEGGNGKSTLIDVISGVLGTDYATAAPKGMLTVSRNDRHPTELADLRGVRLVTSSESKKGDVIDEEFIKMVTGNDRIRARKMHCDFFEFIPTNKLQLLTNHKPRILSQNFAIWRRCMMVPYTVKYGSQADVKAGHAQRVKDETLPEALKQELPGILNWIIRGAVDWYAHGLNPPDTVIEATAEYRASEDIVGRFVEECCELGKDFEVPLLQAGCPESLFPRYQTWCKEHGHHPSASNSFTAELRRVVPGFESQRTKRPDALAFGSNPKRVNVTIIKGIR
jgi:putative DNA primase/helicase